MLNVKNTAAAVALVASLASCAGTPDRQVEHVTYPMAREALGHAARLSGGVLDEDDAPARITIMMTSHDHLEELAGGRKVHAAVYMPKPQVDSAVLWLDESRPWQSDRGHTFGILIHELSHHLGADEILAHSLQAAWLREQGDVEMAGKVLANVER